MTTPITQSNIPSDSEVYTPTPREIARQDRIDVLRRNGYSEARLAALEGDAPIPALPDDLTIEAEPTDNLDLSTDHETLSAQASP